MLQVKPLIPLKIVEWGWSFDGSAAATPGAVELIETDVAATVTAYVNADITKLDSDAKYFESLSAGNTTTYIFSIGTAASGYTASAEGTITAVRNLTGPQLGAPTNEFIQQFPLSQEPTIYPGSFTRIRVTFAAAVNMLCYLKLAA